MKKILFLVLILVANVSFGQVKRSKKKKIVKVEKVVDVNQLYNNSAIDGEHLVRKESNVNPESVEAPIESIANVIVVDDVFNTWGLEVRPEFPGGNQAFYKFVGNNYQIPDQPNLSGKVFVEFIIEKDGSLSDIKVLRDIGFGTGAEAIRVLTLCPKWIPGKQNGTEVRCKYSLPITIDSNRGK